MRTCAGNISDLKTSCYSRNSDLLTEQVYLVDHSLGSLQMWRFDLNKPRDQRIVEK